MIFSSFEFIFVFLPLFLILYRFLPAKCQKYLLAFGGLIFYAVGQHRLVLGLMASFVVNYLFHIWISTIKKKTPLLAIAIVFNSAVLIACKVFGYLPLGISFYTFQVISMQIDCKNDMLTLGDFGAMLCCFPKLTMGPISRMKDWKDVLKESENKHLLNVEGLEAGLKLFTVGLAFKIVLADNIATLWNSIRVNGVFGMTVSVAWLGAIAYTMELYFDFYGYSLMAVGLGKILGIPIPENFNEPYSSRSIGEFWRCWNLTLGEWFRDYIYIPLGGNRKGKFRTALNLLIVWALTGVWHGWGRNYLIWAGVLFILIMLERITPIGKISKLKVIGNIYVCIIMPITWIIFSISDVNELWLYIKCMFGIYSDGSVRATGQIIRYLAKYWYLLVAGVVFMTPFPRKLYEKIKTKHYVILPLLLMLGLSLYFIYTGLGNVFMYFNF